MSALPWALPPFETPYQLSRSCGGGVAEVTAFRALKWLPW